MDCASSCSSSDLKGHRQSAREQVLPGGAVEFTKCLEGRQRMVERRLKLQDGLRLLVLFLRSEGASTIGPRTGPPRRRGRVYEMPRRSPADGRATPQIARWTAPPRVLPPI